MKKIFFVFLLIFSLLIINGKEYKCEAKEDSFNQVESYLINEYDFIENGIKLEYTMDGAIEDEYKRIKGIFEQKNDVIISENKNCISIKSENINYSVNMYNYENLIKVEVVLINSNSNNLNESLIALSKEIRNDNFIDERYFSFIKGKISTSDRDIVKNIKKSLNIEISESLYINNGYIAKATMNDKSNINIGQINYDTGSYLIIGTPIIFVTY